MSGVMKVNVELNWEDAKTLVDLISALRSRTMDEARMLDRVSHAIRCAHPTFSSGANAVDVFTAIASIPQPIRIPMTPGIPLTEDDKQHVEQVLYDELAAGRSYFHTP